jgi:hypothetical protein
MSYVNIWQNVFIFAGINILKLSTMKRFLFSLLVTMAFAFVQARSYDRFTVLQWNIWQEGTVVPGDMKPLWMKSFV